jgi:D-alanyl-D-alanine carboxypeptidase
MKNHRPNLSACFVSLVLLITPLTSIAQTNAASVTNANNETLSSTAQQIDTILSRQFSPDKPGATVIVTRDGKTLLRKAYGLSRVEDKSALRPDTLMLVGSITKQFTAVAILQLMEAGKLKLEDDIHTLLPQLPGKGQKITVAQLLSHTSGVRNFFAMPGFEAIVDKPLAVPQVYDFFKNEPLEFSPGERFAYSNTGYFLLGLVIERLSGTSYADYVAQHIFKPLHMRHTAYEGHQNKELMHAHGYVDSNGAIKKAAPFSVDIAYSAGALVSTVDDLALWDQAVTAQKLLSASSWAQALRPYKLNNDSETGYGFGWMNFTVQGVAVNAHDGIIPGYNAFAIRVPQYNVYVAILSNYSNVQPSTALLGETVAAIAMGKPFPDYQTIALSAAQLEKFVGAYRIDEKENRLISRDGQRLFMQRGNRPPVEILPYAENEFFIKDSPSRLHLRFDFDANGKVNQMTVVQNGNTSICPKIVLADGGKQ